MITDGEWIAVEAENPIEARPKQRQKVIFIGRVRTAKMPHVKANGQFSHGHPDEIEKLCVVTKQGWPLPVPQKHHQTCAQTFIEALRMQGELKESDA